MKTNTRRIGTLMAVALGLIVWGRCGGTMAQAQKPAGPSAKEMVQAGTFQDWATATPESQGMSSAKLEALWKDLRGRDTSDLLVIRNDAVVFERYGAGASRTTKHGTASQAKALVGGVSLITAMTDGRISPDDRASKYVPQWRSDPRKQLITVRELATHTSGIEDAEQDDIAHEKLTGWKGDFWKSLEPPRDPFTLAREDAPVLDTPGTKERYSNPGMAMLAYCLTASLRGTPDTDLRNLLKHRILQPIGVPDSEWSCGYGKTVMVDGLPLVADWGGAAYSPNASARVGRLMMRRGDWNGKPLLDADDVKAATSNAGMPNASGLGWWVNLAHDGSKRWPTAPDDAFSGAGAGHQFLLVVPSLNLIMVRNGTILDAKADYNAAIDKYLVRPLMECFTTPVAQASAVPATAPYSHSPIVQQVTFAPANTIIRQATDSDCWPTTWADDGDLYTAYGDGSGFGPQGTPKLSLGLARVSGAPPHFTGVNIRTETGEQMGAGPSGRKASGLLMVGGVLYLWARNASNSQLARSADHGRTWTWADWKWTTSFGCPVFLNFGQNYAEARDGFVYVYSPDSETAYAPADCMVLARVPKAHLRDQSAYEFFVGADAQGKPRWSKDVTQRGAVFTNAGRCLRSQIVYDAPIRRYLWCQPLPHMTGDQADTRFVGGLGIYDAPEPWGPWTTAFFTDHWDVGPGESAGFPAKWISADGKTLTLVFSGDDSFSVRQATLRLNR